MPIVNRVEQLTHLNIPAKIYYSLPKESQEAVNVFIDLGGKGWETALEMQDKLWETQKGRSIDNLRWALERANIDPSLLLGWTRYRTIIGESNTCQTKATSQKKSWISTLLKMHGKRS